MATVAELSSPYENHLVKVLPAGAGVCRICHTIVLGDWDQCYQCNKAVRRLPTTASAVAFVALAVKNEQLARELWLYKNARPEHVRNRVRLGLASVLWRWLAGHEQCLADRAGVTDFPVVTTVPSTNGRADHPLDDLAGHIVGATAKRFRPLLRAVEGDGGGRDFGVDRFDIVGGVDRDVPVLLVDDTWTSGAHAQSAAAALRAAGSGPVAIACIGRHFNRHPVQEEYRRPAEAYYRNARTTGWSWAQCCLCDAGGAPGSPDGMDR